MRMGRSFWNNPVNTLRACISHINKNSVNAQRIIIQAVTDPFTPVPKVGVLEPATPGPTGAPSCAPSCSGSPTLRRAGLAGSTPHAARPTAADTLPAHLCFFLPPTLSNSNKYFIKRTIYAIYHQTWRLLLTPFNYFSYL